MPPEILQDIFVYTLAENELVLVKQDLENYAHIVYEKKNLAVRGLGLSCRQIYLEIAKYQLFYANNVFKFDQMETALCWLHRRTHDERQALRSLWIAYGGLHQEATIQIGDMHRLGRPTVQARNNLAALFGDVEFPGLQELPALSTLKKLSFNLDILSRDENAATRNKVFLIYYTEAACFLSPRNSIRRAILRAIFPSAQTSSTGS
ncbi:hypothetical protein NA56DRAFT_702545 [Hyaloscypha hepaticicola]|uniref:Uncharacterized protein n=1 Tax=Hyaloscypha hepaticicola TaxID=2082293 RepID=A0A2J6Q7D7_9HELO|nr:hypothetical protein NA56DRAFT_702545 [Hyaloscypha hepaticicola]